MEQANHLKSRPTLLFVLIGILCLVVFAGVVFWQYQKPERKSDANEQNQSTTDNQSSNTGTTNTNEEQSVGPTENLYREGAAQLAEKNYSEAIKYFDQAIAQNPYEPQYFSDKSGAQYNLGQKYQAIETLKQGLSLNPDSDLLKSKLDVLTKDQFSDPSAEATRE